MDCAPKQQDGGRPGCAGPRSSRQILVHRRRLHPVGHRTGLLPGLSGFPLFRTECARPIRQPGATVYLMGGFGFSTLTATRKILLLSFLAPVLGLALDFGAKDARRFYIAFSLAAGAATIWVFWSLLQQKDAAQALRLGATVAVF